MHFIFLQDAEENILQNVSVHSMKVSLDPIDFDYMQKCIQETLQDILIHEMEFELIKLWEVEL